MEELTKDEEKPGDIQTELVLCYTIEEVAYLLKSSVKSIRRLCKSGKMPAIKVGAAWRVPRKYLANMFNIEIDQLPDKIPDRIPQNKIEQANILARYWNDHIRGKIPRIMLPLSKGRAKRVVELIAVDGFKENFTRAIDCLNKNGYAHGDNNYGWIATFDWFIRRDDQWERCIEFIEGRPDKGDSK